jgi:hypothetical protein
MLALLPLVDEHLTLALRCRHHWVVGLTETELVAVVCKGDDKFPSTLPRPVITLFPLALPLVSSDPAELAVEKEWVLSGNCRNSLFSSIQHTP